MAINFNILNPQAPKQGVIATLGSSGGESGGGLSDLMSGLTDFAGAITGKKAADTSNVIADGGTNSGTALNRVNNMSGQMSGIQSISQSANASQNNGSIWSNATKQLGAREGDSVLSSYLQKANPNLDPTTTPWCAGYVNSVLNASGVQGTGSLAAKSYLKFGQPTDKPSMGDIVVLNRTDNPNLGHVGFYAGDDGQGNIKILGGNQGNSVSIKSYPRSQVAGFRVPPSGGEVQQYAASRGLKSPQDIARLPTQQYNIPNAHPDLSNVMEGIAHVETGSESNPYSAMGKATNRGDRAYGKYQIMGANIPSWSREALGYPLTPQQFLKDPQAQEQVAAFQLNKNLLNGASPQDTASIWFSGRPINKAGNSKDAYGTSVPDYVKKFNQGYLQARESVLGVDNSEARGQAQSPPVQAPINPFSATAPKNALAMLVKPVSPYPDGLIQPPQGLSPQRQQDMIREMDQGSDYASTGGINWGLLDPNRPQQA